MDRRSSEFVRAIIGEGQELTLATGEIGLKPIPPVHAAKPSLPPNVTHIKRTDIRYIIMVPTEPPAGLTDLVRVMNFLMEEAQGGQTHIRGVEGGIQFTYFPNPPTEERL